MAFDKLHGDVYLMELSEIALSAADGESLLLRVNVNLARMSTLFFLVRESLYLTSDHFTRFLMSQQGTKRKGIRGRIVVERTPERSPVVVSSDEDEHHTPPCDKRARASDGPIEDALFYENIAGAIDDDDDDTDDEDCCEVCESTEHDVEVASLLDDNGNEYDIALCSYCSITCTFPRCLNATISSRDSNEPSDTRCFICEFDFCQLHLCLRQGVPDNEQRTCISCVTKLNAVADQA